MKNSDIRKLSSGRTRYRTPIPAKFIDTRELSHTWLVEAYYCPPEKLKEDIARVELEICNEVEEHLYIYTKEGEVYHLLGNKDSVNACVICEDLSESIMLHNHPKTEGYEDENGPSINDFFNAIDFKVKELRVVDQKNRFVSTFTPAFMEEVHSGNIPNRGAIYDRGYESAKKKYGEGFRLISLVWEEMAALGYGMSYYKNSLCNVQDTGADNGGKNEREK